MRKTVITLLFCWHGLWGVSQDTWSLKAVAQEMTMGDYQAYMARVDSYRKLKTIARACSKAAQYQKAIVAYEYMFVKFKDKIEKKDVGDFYTCLLNVGRIDDVPYPGLEKFSNSYPDLMKIARTRREARDGNDEQPSKYKESFKGQGKLIFGYTLHNNNKICLYSDSLERMYTYEFRDTSLGKPGVLVHGFKGRYNVVAVEKLNNGGYMYTVFDNSFGLYRIEIESENLPNFSHNSRYHSTGMPWFDAKTQTLFFCADNKNGYGGWDIYSTKLKKKRWLKPELLDEQVNTPFDEIFPYVKNDMLLYSSDGRKGKGGFDNFAFDLTGNINYNLFDCNSPEDDYCIRLLNDSTDFFTCRGTKILQGHYVDFWDRFVSENKVEEELIKGDPFLQNRLRSFYQENKNPTKYTATENTTDTTYAFEQANSNTAAEDITNAAPVPAPVETRDNTIIETVAGTAYAGIKNNTLSIEDVLVPEVQNFDFGEPVYYPFNEDSFDQKFSGYLDQCISYFAAHEQISEILVYASSDPRGSDSYNYLLSLNRARNMIDYLEKHFERKINYKTIALGEQLFHENQPKSLDEYREVFFRTVNFEIPYNTMIAVPKSAGNVTELAKRFNNSAEILEKLDDFLCQDQFSSVYLVGINTIHRVQKGENIYKLKYGCSADDILRANNKTSPSLTAGELLIIPLPGDTATKTENRPKSFHKEEEKQFSGTSTEDATSIAPSSVPAPVETRNNTTIESVAGNNTLSIEDVLVPEVQNFDFGEPVYYPFNEDSFDQKFYGYLDQCVSYFAANRQTSEMLVYASSDPRGADSYNYQLSLNRVRNMIDYMEKQAETKINYKTIALGEQLFYQNQPKSLDKYREVFFRTVNFEIPYNTMIAVPKSAGNVTELAKRYNNPVKILEKLDDFLCQDQFSSVYLVGIKTIHRIQKGENVYQISLKYGCTVDDILRANNKKSASIKVGELLIIPLSG